MPDYASRNPYTVPGAVDAQGRLRVTVNEETPDRKEFMHGALSTGLFVGAAAYALARISGRPSVRRRR